MIFIYLYSSDLENLSLIAVCKFKSELYCSVFGKFKFYILTLLICLNTELIKLFFFILNEFYFETIDCELFMLL